MDLEQPWNVVQAPPERFSALELCAARLEEVLRREPDWALAQIVLVDIQAELLDRSEARRKLLAEPLYTSSRARLMPDSLSDDAHHALDPSIGKALLEERHGRHGTDLQATLRRLLPHRCFHPHGGVDGLELGGGQVQALIDSQQRRWTRDFTEIHVVALIFWSRVLKDSAPEEALKLCSVLRRAFYPTDLTLLEIQGEAALRLAGGAGEDERWSLERTAEGCEALIRVALEADLRIDPGQPPVPDALGAARRRPVSRGAAGGDRRLSQHHQLDLDRRQAGPAAGSGRGDCHRSTSPSTVIPTAPPPTTG